jgi:outer membrane protein assembly factor BamD
MIGIKAGAKFVSAALLMAVLSGCGGDGGAADQSVPLESYTPQQIFERGEFELARSRAKDAAFYFSEIERLYPYSEYAKQALIMQAFANHKSKDYEGSRGAAQRFIDFYPTDEDAAYAQYLLALSYYDQIDEVGRDQGLTFQALQSLRTVIEVYPDSEYATSAILKFDLAFDHLAGKEMEIGRYYLRRGHYTSAINLHRLVEAYLSLGLTEEAQTAGAILGHNYQSTDWYEDSYKLLTSQGLKLKDRGNNWLSQIYRQSIKGRWL